MPHGKGQPPDAIEVVAKDAVKQPCHKAYPEPCRHAPVNARSSVRALGQKLRPDTLIAPPAEAQQKDHAEREAHQTVRVQHVKVEVVRMADSDKVFFRRETKIAKGCIVLSGSGPEPRVFEKDAPTHLPQAPSAVIEHLVHVGAALGQKDQKKGRNGVEQAFQPLARACQ